MISGTHAIIYASDPEAARAFLRDVLGFPFVDAHDGWLIFKLPAELGVHPAGDGAGSSGAPPGGHHELYLMCDDVQATVSELEGRGVQILRADRGSGIWADRPAEDPGCRRARPLRAET